MGGRPTAVTTEAQSASVPFHLASISRKHQLSIRYAPGLRLGAGHSRRTALGPVLQMHRPEVMAAREA